MEKNKIPYNGPIGLCTSVTVSDNYIAHARSIEAFAGDADRALQDSCDKYLRALDKYVKKYVDSLSLADWRLEIEGAVEKWQKEQKSKISSLVAAKDEAGLKKMISDLKNGTIAPGKDIRMVTFDGQVYASNKKYSTNKTHVVGGRSPHVIR